MRRVEARERVVVIGAGIGGLSAAIHLAIAGRDVLILEKNAGIGGKMGYLEQDGFRWDTGPSVITMRHVLDELFASAGRCLGDYLELRRLDPVTRYFFADGSRIDASADMVRMARQIERIEPRDVDGYLRFLSHAAKLYRITAPAFIHGPPPGFDTMRRVPLTDALGMDAWRSMDAAIRGHVRSPQLRQLLGRFATYVGASPYRAPATLGVIAHVEMTGGVWYPTGGVYSIASALGQLAAELGVEIRRNAPVDRIDTAGGRVSGVRLRGGETIRSGSVVANADIATVYRDLLPQVPGIERLRQRLTGIDRSCSGFLMLLGVEGKHPQLAHHNIFFSPDSRREFSEIFDRGRPPGDPTVYVAITSKSDPGHAPGGCENWYVLVNAPALDSRWDWRRETDAYQDVVLRALARHGLDVGGRIRCRSVVTPLDLERQTGAWRGALYGTSSNRMLDAFRRPHNRCRQVEGLYFAGGTTHPGGGVPMVMLSGKLAARMLLARTAASAD